MQISNTFPVLQKQNALLVVSGKQHAKLFSLRNEQIQELSEINVLTPEYTDREGHFEHSGLGQVYGSGSVYEPKKNYIITKFIKALAEETNKFEQGYDQIYLFAPQHLMDSIDEALRQRLPNKPFQQFAGNYTKLHPTKLMEIIKSARVEYHEHMDSLSVPADARKILDRNYSG